MAGCYGRGGRGGPTEFAQGTNAAPIPTNTSEAAVTATLHQDYRGILNQGRIRAQPMHAFLAAAARWQNAWDTAEGLTQHLETASDHIRQLRNLLAPVALATGLPVTASSEDVTAHGGRWRRVLAALLAESGVTFDHKGFAEVAAEVAAALAAGAAPGTPTWLPAWATEVFFRNNPAFAAAVPPTTIDGAHIHITGNAATGYRNPGAADFPEFSARDRYWEWGSMFGRFTSSFAPTAAVYGQVLHRALGRFTGELAPVAVRIDVQAAIQGDREGTRNTFLAITNGLFLSAGYPDTARDAYRAIRPATSETAATFLGRFETASAILNEVANATGHADAVAAAPAVAERILSVISAETRNELRRHRRLV